MKNKRTLFECQCIKHKVAPTGDRTAVPGNRSHVKVYSHFCYFKTASIVPHLPAPDLQSSTLATKLDLGRSKSFSISVAFKLF